MKSIVKAASQPDNRFEIPRPPPKDAQMKKTSALILSATVVSIAICAAAGAQSSPKRRTPALTNDDLGSAREAARLPAETESQPTSVREPDVVRGAIAWHRDPRKAIEIARAENKLVVADVYTDWCGWCKRMDQTIYSNPAIVTLSRQHVFIKVDAEDGGQGQNFAEQMRVQGYPTTIILDGQGKVLNIIKGYIASPRAFGELVQEARSAR
jgi:thiol:disulfide interchange protein